MVSGPECFIASLLLIHFSLLESCIGGKLRWKAGKSNEESMECFISHVLHPVCL